MHDFVKYYVKLANIKTWAIFDLPYDSNWLSASCIVMIQISLYTYFHSSCYICMPIDTVTDPLHRKDHENCLKRLLLLLFKHY